MKPRLLMICHLPPPVHGAATVSANVVASPQLRHQFEIDVVNLSVGSKIDAIRKFSVSKAGRSLLTLGQVAATIVHRPPALAYITVSIAGFSLFRDLALVLMLNVFGVSRVFHMHTRGVRKRHDQSWLYRLAYRHLFGGAHVIHLSQQLVSDLSPVVHHANITVVPNGIDPGCNISAGVRQTGARPRILFLSNLLRAKGPLDLLAASDLLASRAVPHEIIFVGAQREPDVVRRIREAVQRDPQRISLRGALFGKEKDQIWHEVDIFALPTYYEFECQPLVLMEAMAQGIPSVATREGAIPDMIVHGVDGLLCDRNDIQALAENLEQLIGSPELRYRLGNAARRKFLEAFQLSRFQADIARVISSLACQIAAGAKRPSTTC